MIWLGSNPCASLCVAITAAESGACDRHTTVPLRAFNPIIDKNLRHVCLVRPGPFGARRPHRGCHFPCAQVVDVKIKIFAFYNGSLHCRGSLAAPGRAAGHGPPCEFPRWQKNQAPMTGSIHCHDVHQPKFDKFNMVLFFYRQVFFMS